MKFFVLPSSMSTETSLTQEEFLRGMRELTKRFDTVDEGFAGIHQEFSRVHATLREHEELLEIIAAEVSGTQNRSENHEIRISRLERGFTKILLDA
jgi:septation ring formation regulator EzrA